MKILNNYKNRIKSIKYNYLNKISNYKKKQIIVIMSYY